ncbi:HFM1 [Sanghuangporus sanghuang]
MSEDFDFDEFLDQFGDDGEPLLDDSGVGFNSYDYGRRDGYGTYPNMQCYSEDHFASEYRDTAPMTLRNRYDGQLDDEIGEFGSSDPSAYGMSSPTPNQSRGFVVPAALQAPTPGSWASATYQVRTPSQNELEMHKYNSGPILQRRGNDSVTMRSTSAPFRQTADTRGANPRNTHNLRLRPVSDLPDIYRGIFKFGVFNAVQSKCYDTIMETTENMVVSAPTGGGKTVLFELGLIAMLMNSRHQSSSKCVYVAPTKALCSERTRDWTTKLEPLGIKCCEMTGDTIQMGKSAWTAARTAKVIITTSEKWDSLTRGWHDHGDFLSEIKLFLVDEVHVLNEPRGSTLEVIISRMKARASNIRFIMVSATVPNIRDIADWIGNPSIDGNASATVFEFGEDYRPCKITRHIYGFTRKNQNDFQFSRTLDYKVYSALEQHACGKPILIFCSTRKGTLTTAEQLLKEYEEAVTKKQKTAWAPPKHLNHLFHDKRLEKLAKVGLGVHHAGLSLEDRRAIEDLYLDGTLRVVCATSTLAVGVNLPAHTVVIKGVKLYAGTSWQEYSDLDIIQMIGRAGRPQFDKEGIAIILCEQDLEHKYRNLAQGSTILESSLHENLLEHINSEIGIGAISDLQSAKDWLRNSFLRQRIQKNPGHYHIGKTAGQTWEEKMDDMVLQAVEKLKTNELIYSGGKDKMELRVTEYGDIMSKYYVRQSTMGGILKISDRATIREILEVISCADELEDVRLRGGDKQVYNKMRDHPDIRYKIKKVEKASDKAFMLIQAVLGGISLSAPEYKTADSQPALDALSIFRHAARIARVVVEVAIIKKNGAQLKHGLELVRCLMAKAWEDRSVVLKQIESIGEKSLKVLAEHGITSLKSLEKQEPSRIEMLLSRRPPYGHEVLQQVQDMPHYGLSISVDRNGVTSYSGKKAVSIELNVECSLLQALPGRKKFKQKTKFLGMTNVLTTTSDLDLIDFRRISTKTLSEPRMFTVNAELTKPSQSICVLISSETFAGLTVTQVYKPLVPANEYPTMNTQPKSANDVLIEASQQDPPKVWDETNCDLDEVELRDAIGCFSPLVSQARSPLEPKTLPNGNYACNHNCKDKSACRHLCCREGLAKPPLAPKKVLEEKRTAKETVKANNRETKKSREPAQKKATKEDTSLRQLESLHKHSGVAESIHLDEGRRLKLDPIPAARNPGVTVKPSFDVQFADLNEESERNEDSSDDMPNTQDLLGSTQPKKRARDACSDNSFGDSELDAIMLTMDTVNPIFDSANVSLINITAPNESELGLVAPKRTTKHTRESSSELSQSSREPAPKKTRLDMQPKPQSDNDPLFLHTSSLSSSRPTSTALGGDLCSANDYYPDEYFFSLDNSMFNVLPPSLPAQTGDSRSDTTQTNTVQTDTAQAAILDNGSGRTGAHTVAADAKAEGKDANDFDCMDDDWADMEDWIMNSGAVQIVG